MAELHDRAAATGAGACGAAEAMITGHDLTVLDLARLDVPQEKSRSIGILPLHPELLIKIAIINFAALALKFFR